MDSKTEDLKNEVLLECYFYDFLDGTFEYSRRISVFSVVVPCYQFSLWNNDILTTMEYIWEGRKKLRDARTRLGQPKIQILVVCTCTKWAL